jgi:DNA primase
MTKCHKFEKMCIFATKKPRKKNFANRYMIDNETKERIMDAVQIQDVIGDFVSLRKRGANYVACCPFHDEKTPSFSVSPSKGIYKCFGCGKSGDSVTFLMDHEHYSYPEALRYLANKYHIEIKEEELTEEQQEQKSERDALYNVSEFAQKYFADILYNDEMGRAIGLSYLHQRGMSDDIIKKFGLGYCPDEWSAFTDHAHKNGYSDNVLEKTGLTIFHDDGKKFDRFRGRVMFPLYNMSGRVLAFSGRVLKKEQSPAKYMNSPESEIYTKGRNLYGLYQARSAVVKQDKCFLVEGNIDVVSMHQSGVENTVASWGTSLTEDQIRQIKRFTTNVTVIYDGDAAGVHATLRAVDMLYRQGLHVRVAFFPDGEDPDSYAQKYGSTQLQEFLSTHEENFVSYRLRQLTDEVKRDPIRKAEAVKEVLQTIALVPDLLERSEYISLCASKFGMPETTLQGQLAQIMAVNARKAFEEQKKKEETGQDNNIESVAEQSPQVTVTAPRQAVFEDVNPDETQERELISLLVNNGKTEVNMNYTDPQAAAQMNTVQRWIVDDIEGDGLHFENPLYQSVFDIFADHCKQGDYIDGHYLMLDDNIELRTLASSLMLENSYQLSEHWKEKHIYIPTIEENLARDVDESILLFKQKKLERMIADNARQIQEMVDSHDETDMLLLLEEKKKMDAMRQEIGKLLNRVITI